MSKLNENGKPKREITENNVDGYNWSDWYLILTPRKIGLEDFAAELRKNRST